MKIDPHQYDISGPHYNPETGYWSVAYYRRGDKRVAFTVCVSDQMKRSSIDQDSGGIFEGALTEKLDYH